MVSQPWDLQSRSDGGWVANFAHQHNYRSDLPARCLELPHLCRVEVLGHHVDTPSVFCACEIIESLATYSAAFGSEG